MARATPTPVFHFTHVDHLASVVEHGIICDNAAHEAGLLSVEVGNVDIKDRRRYREVLAPPGGRVADYVPFYFGPRSPMMFAIAKGNVPTYQGGTGQLIYLVTTLERLHELGLPTVVTDRNAALDYARHRSFTLSDRLDDGFVAWDVVRAQYWTDFDDGRERRMAEALVHQRIPWEAIERVGVRDASVQSHVQGVLARLGVAARVDVVPAWYF